MITGKGKASEARFGLKAATEIVGDLENPGKLSTSFGFTVVLRGIKQEEVIFQLEQFRKYLKKFQDEQQMQFTLEIDEANGLKSRILDGIQERYAAKQKQEEDSAKKAEVFQKALAAKIKAKQQAKEEACPPELEVSKDSPPASDQHEESSSIPPADPQVGPSSTGSGSDDTAA